MYKGGVRSRVESRVVLARGSLVPCVAGLHKGASRRTFPARPAFLGGACCVLIGSAGPHFPFLATRTAAPCRSHPLIKEEAPRYCLTHGGSTSAQRSVGARLISRSRAVQHCPAARGAWLNGQSFVTAFASKSGARRLPDIRLSSARSSSTQSVGLLSKKRVLLRRNSQGSLP